MIVSGQCLNGHCAIFFVKLESFGSHFLRQLVMLNSMVARLATLHLHSDSLFTSIQQLPSAVKASLILDGREFLHVQK